MRSFGETNPGRKRRRNEDAFVCDPPLFAVADGMGGAQAGEIASSLAAAALSRARDNRDPVSAADAEQVVRGLIRDANTLVHERATHDAAASGMGTTMTVALARSDDMVTIGHVGDSRAYLLRDGSLEQLTDDHSLVAELVRRGELSPAEAEVHPQRSVITRALGTDPEVEIDVFSIEGQNEDIFLLCSDGLSTMVDGDVIVDILDRNRGDLEAATRELIRAANDGGGDDNITAVLFELQTTNTPKPFADPVPEADPDEDTLHPEDGVPVIALAAEEPAEEPAEPATEATAAATEDPADTTTDEVTDDVTDEAAAEAEATSDPTADPVAEPATEETTDLTTEQTDEATVAETTEETAEPAGDETEYVGAEAAVRAAVEAAEPEPQRLPLVRLVLATFVIIILATLIVVLALWGLAR